MTVVDISTVKLPLEDVPPGRDNRLLQLRSSTDKGKQQAGTFSSPNVS